MFFEIFKEQLSKSNFSNNAVIIAFYLLLSIFPILIAIGNVISVLNIDPDVISDTISRVLPGAIESILGPIIARLLTTGSATAMSLSIISLLWAATQGISQIETGINNAYGFMDTRTGIIQRIVWVVIFIGALLTVVATVLFLTLGRYILNNVGNLSSAVEKVMTVVDYIKWPIAAILILLLLTVMYMFMPKTKVTFLDALPGSIFVGCGWIILTKLFALYLQFSANSLNMYGIMSTFFILMFWLDFVATLILIGAVVNSSIQMIRKGKLHSKKDFVDKIESKAIDKAKSKFKKN